MLYVPTICYASNVPKHLNFKYTRSKDGLKLLMQRGHCFFTFEVLRPMHSPGMCAHLLEETLVNQGSNITTVAYTAAVQQHHSRCIYSCRAATSQQLHIQLPCSNITTVAYTATTNNSCCFYQLLSILINF
jgi:hypothetical protein